MGIFEVQTVTHSQRCFSEIPFSSPLQFFSISIVTIFSFWKFLIFHCIFLTPPNSQMKTSLSGKNPDQFSNMCVFTAWLHVQSRS